MSIQIRADMTQRVLSSIATEPTVNSPVPGVTRQMFDRDGDEVARATSVVHYAAGSSFDAHTHDKGEEFLVLEGVFSDEHGDYPAGTYVRNPPGSRHTPHSNDGCSIFVKLRHFDSNDTQRVVVDTQTAAFSPGLVPGLSVLGLHEYGGVSTALVRWAPGTVFNPHRHWGGEEIYVISGTFSDEYGDYPSGTWIRSPHMSHHHPFSKQGCLIYVKVGHLAQS